MLLGLATIVYLAGDPKSRKWFTRKEPYYCALIALIIFIPVIYWNATHDWASFLFQTSRRLHDYYSFSFHELVGLVLIYLTPTGVMSAWMLFSSKYSKKFIPVRTKYFFQVYVSVPLIIFSLFSLFHGIKINWIGPVFLAILPWLAILVADNQQIMGITFRKGWAISFVVMLLIYSSIIYCILSNKPKINDYLFKNLVPWENFTWEIYNIAQQLEGKTHNAPIILPLDSYHIASEYAFYQQKYFKQGKVNTSYKVIGSHVFDLNSLMYKYWGSIDEIKGKILILISPKITTFSYSQITKKLYPYLI